MTGSLESLFRAEYASLVESLTLVAGSRENAQDAVQEAFARAYQRWDRISRYDQPAAWVRRVALNLIYNDHRRTRRWFMLRHMAALSDVVVPPTDDGSLAMALRSLPLRQRTAVVLFYVADLSIREIASMMGVSEGTVKRHLDRGRLALRGSLGEEER